MVGRTLCSRPRFCYHPLPMATSQPTIVALGEVLWDMLPAGPRPGGAPANFAAHAAALGANAHLVSAVGEDQLGTELLEHLSRFKLDARPVQVNRWPTGTVEVQLDSSGTPAYTIKENVAWDKIAWDESLTDLAIASQCVCFGTLAQRSFISRSTIQAFVQHTLEHTLRICDLNLRGTFYDRQIIEASLLFANVLKLNDEEWPIVAGMLNLPGSIPDGLRELMQHHGISLVALTRGKSGSLLITPDTIDEQPPAATRIVDTVGAGDAFTASLAVGLLRELPLPVIHKAAAATAAFVCSREGATPPLPSEIITLHGA